MIDARLEILNLLPKHSVGLEIGVHKGEFSEKIIEIVNPSRLYLVDPWTIFDDDKYDQSWYGKTTPQEEMNQRHDLVVEKFKTNANVTIIRDLSTDAAKELEDNSLDFIYIDGDHYFKSTYKDLIDSFEVLKVNGFIIIDDFIAYDFYKKNLNENPFGAIIVFLNKFRKNIKFIKITNQLILQKI